MILIVLSDASMVYFNQSAQLQADIPSRVVIHWGVMLIFAVVGWLYLPKKKRAASKTYSFIFVTLVYVGTLLTALFVPNDSLNVATVPLNCAASAFVSLTWLFILQSANRRASNPTSTIALFFGLFVFLPRFVEAFIMYDSNYLTVFAQSIDSLYVVVVVVFIAVCLLTATLLITFRARATQTSSDKEESGRSGQQLSASAAANSGTAAPSTAKHEQEFSERDMETARKASLHERALLSTKDEFGLSNRELEVARMAIGNKSARKIAEELFVSENTVYTHLKHIYRKTGVHSRQEFIDLVEKRSSE